jgi:hypothetical protein
MRNNTFAAYKDWFEFKADVEDHECVSLVVTTDPRRRYDVGSTSVADPSAWRGGGCRAVGRLIQYDMHVKLVENYGDPADDPPLRGMIERFRERILDANHSETDVQLSTVCQAKGSEWDRVELLDDLIPLDVMEPGKNGHIVFAPGGNGGDPSRRSRPDYKGDELNSWFVACTRAKAELRLPDKWWNLVNLARAPGKPVTDRQQMWWKRLDKKQRRECVKLLNSLDETLRKGDAAAQGPGEPSDEPATVKKRRRSIDPPENRAKKLRLRER